MSHPSLTQLLEIIAGEGSPEHDLHATSCASCRAKIAELRRTETALRRLPPERTSAGFTEMVMRRLGVKSAPSIAWVMFRNLAPALALLAVSVIAVVAMKYFGAFEGSDLQQSASTIQSASGKFTSELSKGIDAFDAWLGKYFSFAFAKTSYGLTAFLVFFFGAVALVDKYVLLPMMRKRGM